MLQDPNTRKSIYASVIASAIVIVFIQPILSGVGALLIWGGEHISANISRAIYTSAAIGLREKFSFMLLLLQTGLLSGIATGVSTGLLLRRHTLQQGVQRKPTLIRAITWGLTVLALIATLNLLTINYADFQMNASFNQRIAVLAPAIGNEEVLRLRSAWASMESRGDYLAIVKRMDGLATQHNYKLPKLLWE